MKLLRSSRFFVLAFFSLAVMSVGLACGGGETTTSGATATTTTQQPTTTTTQIATTTTTQIATTTTQQPTTTTTLAPDTWKDLGPTPPSASVYGSMVYDPVRKVALHFGGELAAGYSDSTLAYDQAANTWTDLKPTGTVPSPRSNASMAYDPVGDRFILFGGQVFDQKKDESVWSNDTWAYDPVANTWTDLKPDGAVPSPRSMTSLVYDPTGKKMILFGGRNDQTAFNDTWAYDPGENRWTKLAPEGSPPRCLGFAAGYDPVRQVVLLFGGEGMDGYLDKTWSYDPAANTWTELKPAVAPSARFGSVMVYAPTVNRFILFGGGVYVSRLEMECYGDTWSYDPAANTWTELKPAVAPSARFGSAMVFDPVSAVAILFGGAFVQLNESSIYDDTWSFHPGE